MATEAANDNASAQDIGNDTHEADVLSHIGAWSEIQRYDSIVHSPWALLEEPVFHEPYQFINGLPFEPALSTTAGKSQRRKKGKKKDKKMQPEDVEVKGVNIEVVD
ncbi:hypothetical protein MN608_11078 [Microdochium nivale]|nr:hypothetical protein MN608_11078 [Microdochium nivale]